VPAEVVAELVGVDLMDAQVLSGLGVELVGLEPTAFGVPLRRSAQLSYSPRQEVIAGPV
jgi:hypothetical protein